MTATTRSDLGSPHTGELMSVETVRLDPVRAHVKVSGDLDLSTSAPLWGVLRSHLAAGRRFLRLDVTDVGFLDASALNGLTEAHHAALAARGTLVLTGVKPRITRVLRIAGLHELLFIGGPRADDDLDGAPSSHAAQQPTVWPARPVPWTPLAAASARWSVPRGR